ncbi:MAG: hypothetical protein AAF519_15810, partial [Bacteroidota bacterium]
MMARVGFISFIIGLNIFCLADGLRAQIIDDFSDGNFDKLPMWTSSKTSGEDDYIVLEERLRSNGPAATSAIWISTAGEPTFINGILTWQFDLEYDQAPSGANNLRIYFGANMTDLSVLPSGYYVQLGQSGSDDGIDFYKTTSSDPLISDSEPSVSASIDLSIRLTRTETGKWTLFKSEPGSVDFTTVGTVVDTEVELGDHFGFLVNHTSSRNESFFFDNVILPFPDNIPPSLLKARIESDQNVMLTFSEQLDTNSSENPLNYFLSSIGNPVSSQLDSNTVVLGFT